MAARGDRRRPSPRAIAGLVGLVSVAFVIGFSAAVVVRRPPGAGGSRAGAASLAPAPSISPPAPSISPPAPSSSPPAPESAAPSSTTAPATTPGPSATPTIGQLIGQKLAIRMEGTTPSADLLGRIRRGEVGAVVLFGDNVTDERGLVALTSALHAAAQDGGQPRLLVMIDQEGGRIRRLPWAPPARSASRMGTTLEAQAVRALGASTAKALQRDGIDVDLAPVEDVPGTAGGFMAEAGRTFAPNAAGVTRLATAFATGVVSGGVIPTLKHFPGLGRVRRNTDEFVEDVTASRAQLDRDLAPFRAGIAAGMPLVMLSNATYDAWDAENAAGWSEVIGTEVLRDELGFRGVTITDSLAGTAKARGTPAAVLATRAAAAGTDMLMLTGPEAGTAETFDTLVAEAASGSIPRATLDASYARILALKATPRP